MEKSSPFVRLSMATDITALKRAQVMLVEQQRELAALEERERIGRDLHDNLGQVIASQIAPDQAQFIICDNGVGFDPARPLPDAAHHFGLNIMCDRARELGGSLEIRSAPEHGTQLFLRVPIAPPKPVPALPPGAAALRVLLADDPPPRDGLRHFLTSYGLNVVGVASNGLEAQTLARQTRPDLILMDIHMPECDGIEATRRIKAEFPDQRIIMLTVSTKDETLFAALQAGVSGYLLKSMQIEELFALITDLDDEAAPPIAPQLADKIIAEFQQLTRPDANLNAEQWQILRGVADGHDLPGDCRTTAP